MGPQLGCRFAIFGDVVDTCEVLGLAGIALGPHAVALRMCQCACGIRAERVRTLDLRFLQLSHAIDVIFPRGVRNAYVPAMGDECCPRALARAPPSPCLGASGAL